MPPLAPLDTAAMKTKEPAPGMLDKLKRLHDEGSESDFTFVVGARHFKVHKLVLHLNSKVLHDIAVKHGTRAELKDIEPNHAAAMIKFMYHQTYDDLTLATATKRLEDAVAMNAVANKYKVVDLIAETEARFDNIKIQFIDQRVLKGLAELADKAYSSQHLSAKMRNFVMERVCDHIGALAGQDNGILIGTLLRKPKLAIELLRMVELRKPDYRRHAFRDFRFFQHCGTIVGVSTLPYEDFVGEKEHGLPIELEFVCPACEKMLKLEEWKDAGLNVEGSGAI